MVVHTSGKHICSLVLTLNHKISSIESQFGSGTSRSVEKSRAYLGCGVGVFKTVATATQSKPQALLHVLHM